MNKKLTPIKFEELEDRFELATGGSCERKCSGGDGGNGGDGGGNGGNGGNGGTEIKPGDGGTEIKPGDNEIK
jgi:hypothetical protein